MNIHRAELQNKIVLFYRRKSCKNNEINRDLKS